jgi:RimJ/RimL family protein N-acetyltransferase
MIETARLLLRPWLESDRAPFAEIGQDPQVMAWLGPLMTAAESDAVIDRMIADQSAHGYCFWAIERREDRRLIGLCGLRPAKDVHPEIDGNIEIGWRLAAHAWGQGYAFEAATASLGWGFAVLGVPRIISYTATINLRSQALMHRLGMHRRPDLDFDHPKVPQASPLRRHISFEAHA